MRPEPWTNTTAGKGGRPDLGNQIRPVSEAPSVLTVRVASAVAAEAAHVTAQAVNAAANAQEHLWRA
jgi:hypothetical protein